jgi:phosphomannomutase
MYYVQQKGLHYGMMVTASHNPALYNGVKIFTHGGRDASIDVTADIERRIAEVRKPIRIIPIEEAFETGAAEIIRPQNDYIDSILDDINTKAIRDAYLHVALDPMYGVSETSIKTILITARCNVDTIHGNHDTLFGRRMPAPNLAAMRELATYVVDKECDLGIATDGDADRIGIIDNCGNYLSPNDVLVLLYWYLVKYRGMKGPCVRNLCTTHRLDRLAESFGETCYEVPVGFKWI